MKRHENLGMLALVGLLAACSSDGSSPSADNGCDPAKVVWEWSAVVIDKNGGVTLDCLRCLDSNSQALYQSCPPAP